MVPGTPEGGLGLVPGQGLQTLHVNSMGTASAVAAAQEDKTSPQYYSHKAASREDSCC